MSEEMRFTPGFNVIVGRNNAGKSALAEALSLHFSNKPHRSLQTLPTRHAQLSRKSKVEVAFTLSAEEVNGLLIDRIRFFHVPILKGRPHYDYNNNINVAQRALDDLLESQRAFTCSIDGDGQMLMIDEADRYSEPPNSTNNSGNVAAIGFSVDPVTRALQAKTGIQSLSRGAMFDRRIVEILAERVYMFKAERPVIASHRFGNKTELASDASNLPEVLNTLQGNRALFDQFIKLVRVIFPEVVSISVRPSPDDEGQLGVLIWPVDPGTRRDDLAMSLAETGTGIGQVLGILYVTLVSEDPRTIIIDEPQSFLHPSAIRKLFEILKEQGHHQYIVTTHSPTALTAADPMTIVVVRKEDSQSAVSTVDIEEKSDLTEILSDLGARLSDVFGADNILWVEGPTEKACFPLIAKRMLKGSLYGTQILAVLHTAELEGKQAERVFDIYARLSSKGPALLPPAIGFIFDREGRTKAVREDLKRKGKGLVSFTQRRMYENYLLNPAAIAAVITRQDENRESPLTAEEVLRWINVHRWDAKYISAAECPKDEDEEKHLVCWEHEVHAAKLLTDLFTHFTDQRIVYNKKVHGVALTRWILDHCPDELSELGTLLCNKLRISSADSVN